MNCLDGLSSTGVVVVDLGASLAALVRPGEVGDGDNEEGVGAVADTGESVVPGQEGSDDSL